LAIGVLLVASCQKPSEKSAGTYNGTFTQSPNSWSGKIIISTNGDKTNWSIQSTDAGINITTNDITSSASGDNVTFSYSSSSTTDNDVTALSGTLTGNNLTSTFSFNYMGGTATLGFTGSK
jgi:hypothetical protein